MMTLRSRTLVLLTLCLLPGPLAAQTPAVAVRGASFDREAADAIVQEQLAKKGVGMSVAIVRDGTVVLARGYGKRSLDGDGAPVETDTLFAIGSVTKQFTCACVLLLDEEGELSVEDKVAKYYPDLTRAADITLLDLMNHVSGYPDYYPLDFVDGRMREPIDPDELLRRYAGGELDFEPGTRWSYSNTGFILLGRIVEKVTGQPFGRVLRERILAPLGMDHTVYEPDPADPRLARGYVSVALGPPDPCTPEARGWIGAAGGIWSTPSDLAKWDLALCGGELLEPHSFALMTTPRRLAGGGSTGYGCGLAVRSRGALEVLGHVGAVDGFVASESKIPSLRAAVIVLGNSGEGLGAVPERLLALVAPAEADVPAVQGPGAERAVRAVFAELQGGEIDRHRFSPEFNAFMTDARVVGAASRLAPFGAPRQVAVLQRRERGGMEVTVSRLTFESGTLRVSMYRLPDGIIAQFLVSAE